MPKKLTVEFIRSSFEEEGYTLLTKEYRNNKQKLEYICPKNHKNSIVWSDWQQGNRCAECSGLKKLTISFIQKSFEKENYRLLSDSYTDCKQPLKYICSNGHEGTICWNNWQQGARCLECSGKKKLTIRFVREQFEKEGYTLLSKNYINNVQFLDYMCPKGHIGTIKWNNWLHNKRCGVCFFESIRGENHPNWNPELTEEERRIGRNYPGYTEWRFAVYSRDNRKCQVCGKLGKEAHHLESYNNNPDLRILLSNGVCLCENCHKNFHHHYGYGNNTRKQFEEFVNNYNNKMGIVNVR